MGDLPPNRNLRYLFSSTWTSTLTPVAPIQALNITKTHPNLAETRLDLALTGLDPAISSLHRPWHQAQNSAKLMSPELSTSTSIQNFFTTLSGTTAVPEGLLRAKEMPRCTLT